MVTEAEYLQALGNELLRVDGKVESIAKALEGLKPEKQELPMYLARNTDQMQEELEKQGKFTKEQPGWQDDLDNMSRLFTQVNEKGELIQGLTDGHGNPASLMQLYQTMDLRGVIWNYGLGWISALKGGFNIGVESGRQRAKKSINEEVHNIRSVGPKEALDYYKSSDELDYYYKLRENEITDKLEFYNKVRKDNFKTKLYESKQQNKKAYLDFLKMQKDIKDFKSKKETPEIKPIKLIQPYWV